MKGSIWIRNESGFTLIELVVGGVVALLVVAGIIATMTMSQRNYFVQDRVSEAQQGVRIGMDLVERDVRMAGYGINRSIGGNAAYFETGAAVGINGANTVSTDGGAIPTQLPGTDAVALYRSKGGGLNIINAPSVNSANWTVDCTGPVNAGDTLTCIATSGEYVTICATNVNNRCPPQPNNDQVVVFNPGGAGACPQGFNSPGGQRPDVDYTGGVCYNTERLVYFVAPVDVADASKGGRLMLYNGAAGGGNNPVVVANDVEDFQAAYCLSNCDNPGPLDWSNAPTAAQEPTIRLVRLALLNRTPAADPKFSSSQQSATAPATTLENHALSATPDGFRRRLLGTTVKVRNNDL